MDPLIFNFKNNNCGIIETYKKYKYFEPKYEKNTFPHHTSNVYHHSIWSARAMEKIWREKERNWIYKDLIKGKIINKYKNLSILLAFFHDIGKIDGRINKLIKINHPQYGYSDIWGRFIFYTKEIFSCIHYDYLNTEFQIHKIIAILAIVSLCHQDFGDIMQGKMTVTNYLKKMFHHIENFDPFEFKILDYELILRLVLLISLVDVQGARPVNLFMQSEWGLLNKTFKKSKLQVDWTDSPWEKYGYNKKARKIIKEILELFYNVTNKKLNKNKKGLAGDNIEKIFINTKNNGINYYLEAGIMTKGTVLYKAMDSFITQNMHKNYKAPSWFASSHTAEGYTGDNGVGGEYKYVFEATQDVSLIYMDNHNNINVIYDMIQANDDWSDDYKLVCINLIQFAFGINASPDLQNKLKDKFVNNKNIKISVQDTFNTNDSNMKRWSYHFLDLRIMNEILCYFQLEGYMASRVNMFNNEIFHEEIALCKGYEVVKITKLEKIVDKKNKIVLNNSKDMINFILKLPNIMNKIIDYSLGGKKKEKKEKKEKVKKNLKKILNYKIGGKNKKNKKIRKHKGINQHTGNLNKEYKYSKKISKSGLKQIVKK